MNISEAKIQLKNALTAYFTKDAYGNFKIPPEAQRPVFLMGPPGIGKTAIVRQVADEMNIGVVAYSITHHTRQSALGLPMIVTREYGGREYHVSEYTMSEIIGSVYDVIEESGAEEGILFLDEINCVSETLTPVMLQFLQFKTFGRHRLPAGWIIVTAGNPPEYNRSARDFDIVTWDRLKRIDIEPDYQAWKTYAMRHNVHGSVSSYLDIRRENFYRIEATPEGTDFVTARGWMDLSDMIHLYEENGLTVGKPLVVQYLQNDDVAGDFAAYYDLYNKYKSDYRVEEILSGKASGEIVLRAKEAGFDERLSLLGLLIGAVTRDFRVVIEQEDTLSELLPILRELKETAKEAEAAAASAHAGSLADAEAATAATSDLERALSAAAEPAAAPSPSGTAYLERALSAAAEPAAAPSPSGTAYLERALSAAAEPAAAPSPSGTAYLERALSAAADAEARRKEQTEKRGILTPERLLRFESALEFLRTAREGLRNGGSGFAYIKNLYDQKLAKMRSDAETASLRLKSLFAFIDSAFGAGDELLIFITELTAGWYSARFISRYGSDEYYACSEQLAFHQRHLALIDEIGAIKTANSYDL